MPASAKWDVVMHSFDTLVSKQKTDVRNESEIRDWIMQKIFTRMSQSLHLEV